MHFAILGLALCAAVQAVPVKTPTNGIATNDLAEKLSDIDAPTDALETRGKDQLDGTLMDGVDQELSSVTGSTGDLETRGNVQLDGPSLDGVDQELSSIAGPTSDLETRGEGQEDDVLDQVLEHVEDILDTEGPSEKKVQEILNTIVNDIQARNEPEVETVPEETGKDEILNEVRT